MKGSSERDQTINFYFCFHWELDILYSHSLCLVSIRNLVLFELHMEPTWLKWEKTRSEIFGVDVVSWEEGWAFDFIFGSSSCSRQSYLLDYLAQGRHMQWDMGVLPIPGNGRKDSAPNRGGDVLERNMHATLVLLITKSAILAI
jgi:hypothetical protein